MALKENMYYWQYSLKHPEPVADTYYIFDEIIVEDDKFIKKVERLRELIISYCVVSEKDRKITSQILDDIHELIMSIDKIHYTEFIAFWKVLDMSFSVFKKSPNQKGILAELLQKYCERRRKLYDKLGYSNVTVQALYDSGASRSKGVAGITKFTELIDKTFGKTVHAKTINDLMGYSIAYFFPDKGDKNLFGEFCKKFNIQYDFGKSHQEKQPDAVLKLNEHFFITELKHIKESGGGQDKQIVETIDFIGGSEDSEKIHYISFMDGVYFNNFAWAGGNNTKANRQRKDIENYLNENKNNFFVNTAGLISFFKDLRDEVKE